MTWSKPGPGRPRGPLRGKRLRDQVTPVLTHARRTIRVLNDQIELVRLAEDASALLELVESRPTVAVEKATRLRKQVRRIQSKLRRYAPEELNYE